VKVNLVEEFVLGALVAGVTVQECQALRGSVFLSVLAEEFFQECRLLRQFQAHCRSRDLRHPGLHHI
jgi:hypothetical protein